MSTCLGNTISLSFTESDQELLEFSAKYGVTSLYIPLSASTTLAFPTFSTMASQFGFSLMIPT